VQRGDELIQDEPNEDMDFDIGSIGSGNSDEDPLDGIIPSRHLWENMFVCFPGMVTHTTN
jgi:hypothetical protein